MNAILQSFEIIRRVSSALADDLLRLVTRLNAWAAVEHRSDGTHLFPWATTPYVASDYSATGTMTFAPTAAQVLTSRTRVTDTGMHWQLVIAAVAVGGAASTTLQVRLPRLKAGSLYQQGGSYVWLDNAVAGTGWWRLSASNTQLELFRDLAGTNWAAAGTTTVVVSLHVEVA